MELPSDFGSHAPLNRPKVHKTMLESQCCAPVLRNQTLAAERSPTFCCWTSRSAWGTRQADLALVTTLGYGLHRAAAKMLQLDGARNWCRHTPAGVSGAGLGALLYDNVPGGAGHVRELLEYGEELLELTKEVLL